MYKYCMKCGALLDSGLCPNCDAHKLLEREDTAITEDLSQYSQEQNPVKPAEKIVKEPIAEPVVKQEAVAKPISVKPAAQPAVAKSALTKQSHPAITVFLSVCMCVFLLLGLMLLSVRNFMTEDNLTEVAKDVKFSEFVEFVDDAELLEIKYEDGEEYDFADGFYYNIQLLIQNTRGKHVDTKRLEKMLDKTELMELLGEKGAVYFSDIVNNDEEFSLTEREVYEILSKDRGALADAIGYADDELCSRMASVIVQENLVEKMTPENLKDDNPGMYNTIQLLFSWFAIFTMFALAVLPIVYMVRKDIFQAAQTCGMIFTIIGGFFTSGAFMELTLPTLWEIILGNGFLGAFVGGYLTTSLPIFGIILLIGVSMLVSRSLILRKRS